ncbi:hypothetical protein HanPI659440_Chr05g0215151 [Helianthus annuus]|nr:hypothetical protein HanPI659440_Chr05g0215151 [Helianthus annuus]
MFDFLDPPRHLALRPADRVLDEGELGVLGMHLEQFVLPAIPADPAAYISPLPSVPNTGVPALEKRPTRIKLTGRKYMAAGVAVSSIGETAFPGGDAHATTVITSPVHASKKRKTFIPPTLSAFQAVQAAYALPLGISSGTQTENVTSIPVSSVGVSLPSSGTGSATEPKAQASVTAVISCTMPLPTPTASVVVTVDPVSTPRTSSIDPSLFDSPLSIFSAADKEVTTVSVAQEATSVGGASASEAGRSSSGIADDDARLIDDLFLPTVSWDPNAWDKRYQPQWKIAESSRLIFPPVIQHWVERAYRPAEAAYVEGLNNENLMNSAIADSVSQPLRLAEIRRRWMHDNTQLHQAWSTIQELKDDKYRLESQLQAVGLREARFLSEKNKDEDDLKRVTAHLAEERIMWARDMAEKDRVLAQAKSVQEELERKAIAEAQKVQERYQGLTAEIEASHAKSRLLQAELEEREEKVKELQGHCDSLVSQNNMLATSSVARLKEVENALAQSNAEVDDLTSQLAAIRGDKNWLICNGLVGAFEYLRESPPFTALIDRLSAVAYQSGHHDGVYKGYMECQQLDKITPDFHAAKGKLQSDMSNALEAAYTEPLSSYGDLMQCDLDGMERKRYRQRLSEIFRVLDAADGLLQLQNPVTKSMLRKRRPLPNVTATRANRACKSVVHEDPQPVDSGVMSLSADVLTELIPVDHVRRHRLTYEHRFGGCSKKNPVGDLGMVAPTVVGESSSGLAVDPPMLVDGGVVLHTPAEVMATDFHQ